MAGGVLLDDERQLVSLRNRTAAGLGGTTEVPLPPVFLQLPLGLSHRTDAPIRGLLRGFLTSGRLLGHATLLPTDRFAPAAAAGAAEDAVPAEPLPQPAGRLAPARPQQLSRGVPPGSCRPGPQTRPEREADHQTLRAGRLRTCCLRRCRAVPRLRREAAGVGRCHAEAEVGRMGPLLLCLPC